MTALPLWQSSSGQQDPDAYESHSWLRLPTFVPGLDREASSVELTGRAWHGGHQEGASSQASRVCSPVDAQAAQSAKVKTEQDAKMEQNDDALTVLSSDDSNASSLTGCSGTRNEGAGPGHALLLGLEHETNARMAIDLDGTIR